MGVAAGACLSRPVHRHRSRRAERPSPPVSAVQSGALARKHPSAGAAESRAPEPRLLLHLVWDPGLVPIGEPALETSSGRRGLRERQLSSEPALEQVPAQPQPQPQPPVAALRAESLLEDLLSQRLGNAGTPSKGHEPHRRDHAELQFGSQRPSGGPSFASRRGVGQGPCCSGGGVAPLVVAGAPGCRAVLTHRAPKKREFSRDSARLGSSIPPRVRPGLAGTRPSQNAQAPGISGFRGLAIMAEKEGFEPSVTCATHDFQSCTFDHSVTSPHLDPGPCLAS